MSLSLNKRRNEAKDAQSKSTFNKPFTPVKTKSTNPVYQALK